MRGLFQRPRLAFSAAAPSRGASTDAATRFREVMLPHMDAAYSLARYLTRNDAAAEDITQEAFLRAFRSFDGWRGEHPKAWLLAIVRNCFHDTARPGRDPLRGALPAEALEHAVEDGAATPEDLATERSEAAMLRAAVENLPEPFREALVLREFEDLAYKDIAAITQVPVGTVMSRLARARQMLAELLLPAAQAAKEARS